VQYYKQDKDIIVETKQNIGNTIAIDLMFTFNNKISNLWQFIVKSDYTCEQYLGK